MAVLTGGTLVFSPRGTLNKSLVFYPWKGLTCVRKYVVPYDPKTPLQLEQRSRLGRAVDLWRQSFQDYDIHAGWQRLVEVQQLHYSGYNASLKSIMALTLELPDPSFPVEAISVGGDRLKFSMVDIVSNTPGTEGGLFALHWGSDPLHLDSTSYLPIDGAGTMLSPVLGALGDTVFWQMSRLYFRSGITASLLV